MLFPLQCVSLGLFKVFLLLSLHLFALSEENGKWPCKRAARDCESPAVVPVLGVPGPIPPCSSADIPWQRLLLPGGSWAPQGCPGVLFPPSILQLALQMAIFCCSQGFCTGFLQGSSLHSGGWSVGVCGCQRLCCGISPSCWAGHEWEQLRALCHCLWVPGPRDKELLTQEECQKCRWFHHCQPESHHGLSCALSVCRRNCFPGFVCCSCSQGTWEAG